MYKTPDVRFEATYADTVVAGYIVFPISIAVTQSNAAKALVDAKRVAESFCRSITEINIVKGYFKQCSLPEMRDDWPAKIIVCQSSKNEVKLMLGYVGLLTFQEEADFWERASAIAICIDAIQEFCLRSHGKNIEVSVEQPRTQSHKMISSSFVTVS
jgi:hypothetical protein